MAPEPDIRRPLRLMNLELEAARSLLADELLAQAALHLEQAWGALDLIRALEVPGAQAGARQPAPDDQVRREVQRLASPGRGGAGQPPCATLPAPEQRRIRRLLWRQLVAAEAVCRGRRRARRWAGLARVRDALARRWRWALVLAGLAAALALLLLLVGDTPRARRSEPASPAALPVALPPPPGIEEEVLVTGADRVSTPVADGTPEEQHPALPFRRRLEVRFAPPAREAGLDISLDRDHAYRVEFLLQGALLHRVTVPAAPERERAGEGTLARFIELPPEKVAAGYDLVRIAPVEGAGSHCLGHLIPAASRRERAGQGPGRGP